MKLVKLVDNEVKEFYNNHKDHMNSVLNKTVETKRKREVFIKIAGMKFSNIGQIRSQCKKIMNKHKEWTTLNEQEYNLIKEISEYHPNQDKFKKMKAITIGHHPEHKDNKCFYVIREDETKEDFSILKCIQKIDEKYFK